MDRCPECLQFEIAIWKLAAECAAAKMRNKASGDQCEPERNKNLFAALLLSERLERKRQEFTEHQRKHQPRLFRVK